MAPKSGGINNDMDFLRMGCEDGGYLYSTGVNSRDLCESLLAKGYIKFAKRIRRPSWSIAVDEYTVTQKGLKALAVYRERTARERS